MDMVVRDYNEKSITIYRSPLGTFYTTGGSDIKEKYERLYNWLSYMIPEQNSDLENIKGLAQSLKDQNKNLQNKDIKTKPKLQKTFKNDEPGKRLYSAVLQGLPCGKNEHMSLFTNQEEKAETLLCLPIAKLKNTIVNAVSNLQKPAEDLHQSSDSDLLGGVGFTQSNSTDDGKIFNNQQPITVNSPPKVCDSVKVPDEVPPGFLNTYSNFVSNINFGKPSTANITPVNNSGYVNNYSNYQFSSHFTNSSYHQTNNCIYSNNTYCNVSQVVTNRSTMQTYSRNYIPNSYPTYPTSMLMLQQNRSTLYPPLTPQGGYFQQTHQQNFYSHPMSLSLRTGQNLSSYTRNTISSQRTLYPQHFVSSSVPPSHWVQQCYGEAAQGSRLKIKSRKMTNPQVNLLQTRIKMKPPGLDVDDKRASKKFSVPQNPGKVLTNAKFEKMNDFEEVVSKTVDVVLEERHEDFLPIQVSMSEVLELEALEQYNPSNENVYLDLERQAAEQYDPYSENWRGPPTPSPALGGSQIYIIFIRMF
ncbi:unnamed protein product [Brassicogethes aeneus]|uniref:Uncharacterized protein n=1 Tax=Brassicogethes aeneus TaxID=1431903 RepID=A0A9P0FFL4_BRAAE|nr:unnamed protein product [Brassicogethes aeneus]